MNDHSMLTCFEDCVIGDCNRFAYVGAITVVNKPENELTNPLLIWGSSGQGKTHLLRAMEKALINRFPDKKVKYVTADDFTREYISCIQYHKFDNFRNEYRAADFLLFDDVDHLKNKNGIQTEFYNTIVSLLDSGKHLVVSTNEKPCVLDEILNPTLSVRLISGVVFEIEPPDVETKRKLVQKIIDREKVIIDGKVVDYICRSSTQSMSQFICAMNIICEFIRCNEKEDVSVECAKKLLFPIDEGFRKRVITPDLVIDAVSIYFGCTRHRICTHHPNSYKKNYERMVAIALCEDLFLGTENELKKYFGQTVCREKIEQIYGKNPCFEKDVEAIKKELISWQSDVD